MELEECESRLSGHDYDGRQRPHGCPIRPQSAIHCHQQKDPCRGSSPHQRHLSTTRTRPSISSTTLQLSIPSLSLLSSAPSMIIQFCKPTIYSLTSQYQRHRTHHRLSSLLAISMFIFIIIMCHGHLSDAQSSSLANEFTESTAPPTTFHTTKFFTTSNDKDANHSQANPLLPDRRTNDGNDSPTMATEEVSHP